MVPVISCDVCLVLVWHHHQASNNNDWGTPSFFGFALAVEIGLRRRRKKGIFMIHLALTIQTYEPNLAINFSSVL